MTHTLLREKKNIRIEYGPFPLRERPNHAALIAEIINGWSCVYADLAILFGGLLGSEGELGLHLYRGVQNERIQQQLLEEAAREKLAGLEQSVCLAVIAKAKSARKIRNSYAHGIWGYSVQLPDKILRVDIDDWLRGLKGLYSSARKLAPGELRGPPGPTLPPDLVTVLSERDMRRDLEVVLALLKYVRRYWLVTSPGIMGFGDRLPRKVRDAELRKLAEELGANLSGEASVRRSRKEETP